MNRLHRSRQVQILSMLTEGVSICAISRITGVHKVTILKLLKETSEKCEALLDSKMRDIPAKEIQADEIWTYVAKKQRKVRSSDGRGVGDQFIFVALEAETKLVPCYAVGKRDALTATRFMMDLRRRIQGRVQLTTDAFRPYPDAVERAFGADVDYAQLIKAFRSNGFTREVYNPSDIIETIPITIMGNPNKRSISTSYIERQNLTMRMQMRRLTRLTNGFSKKLDNLKAALALHFAWYNFGRIHQTLKVTPAMESGITDHLWGWEDIMDWSN